MKRIILAAVLLIAGFSPSMAFWAHNVGPDMVPKPTLEERVEKLEREADARKLETDLAKPCRGTVAFGCRTGGK